MIPISNLIHDDTFQFLKEHENEFEVNFITGEVKSKHQYTDKDGYILLSISNRIVRAHHAVGYYIFGERMVGKQINHIDGNKANNKPSNLEIVTASDNIKHAFKTGLSHARKGEDSPSSKIKEADVLKMRKLREEGQTLKQIADQFGLSFQHVSRIVREERWTHVGYDWTMDMTGIDFDKYQYLSKRTANDVDDYDDIIQYTMGLASESSEVVNEIKKQIFHSHEVDPEKIKDELSDTLWYMANLARKFNLSLKDIAIHNIEKLRKRYPNGFSVQDSIRRVDTKNNV